MIQKAFNNLRMYLAEAVPELGKIITHWEDLLSSSKNRTVMLNDSETSTDIKLIFNVRFITATVEKNPDTVSQAQMAIMEKVRGAVYSNNNPEGIISMSLPSVEYYDPAPQSPNIGITIFQIQLTVDYIASCNYS